MTNPTLVPNDEPAWRRRMASRRDAFRASGAWSSDTLATLALARCAEHPERVAIIDGDQRVTYARLFDEASRLAAWLAGAGLAPGDVVSYQLPNWREAATLNLAAAMAGLVVNPLVPIYRDAEVGYMLADCRSKALFLPQSFRSFDYLAMARRLRPTLPDLARVIVVRADQDHEFDDFEQVVAGPPMPAERFARDPDALKLILYTSGTTGRAKGVLHTHATIMSAMRAFGSFWSVTPDDCVFMASPVSHITGYLYALEQPFVLSTPAVLMDIWKADEAADLIRRTGCTIAFGATPFLNELADAVERSGPVPSLRLFPCGGAPVPPEVAYRAQRALSPCTVCRIYGATEVSGPIAFGVRNGSEKLAAETDGEIFNAEVRIVDPLTSADVAPAREGEILLRGPQTFVGYLDPQDDDAAFDDRDFFRTGDLGKIDPPGYIVTTGRSKDLIIRGGENLSPREIEDRLLEHPAIREAAVVGMPDERLGEAVCAFVTCSAGRTIDQSEAARFLIERRLAKQKIPIRLEILTELPKTPTGKVRKDLLRTRAAYPVG